MIKDTNAEPHRKSKRKGGKKSHAGPPPPYFPIISPMEELNRN